MAIKISGSTIIDDSRNIVAGVAATFTGNVSIGGTLTYEDVTNIDSVGIVTAQGGIRLAGVVTAITGCSAVEYYGDGSNLSGTGFSPEAGPIARLKQPDVNPVNDSHPIP